jgi:hypothetical protein
VSAVASPNNALLSHMTYSPENLGCWVPASDSSELHFPFSV